MSYIPTTSFKPALGYIQASAVSSPVVGSLVFDIPNDMQTTVIAGTNRTDLKSNAVTIMALSRENDGSTTRSTAYVSETTTTDLRFYGRMPSEVPNYIQSSEFSFDYGNNVQPTGKTSIGSGNILFSNYSHVKIWRA
tara:strand:+ start:580 stop:990 length:411 start_codon:yes stop_codon:yes gene_type:complete